MGRIKHTKNELKAQRQALTRFERFLPMLLLKKQQLQAEIQAVDGKIAQNLEREKKIRADLAEWERVFADPVAPAAAAEKPAAAGVADLIATEEIQTDTGNIAGVAIPLLRGVRLRLTPPDLFSTPPWYDDALEVLQELIRLRVEREVFQEQRRRIAEELRTTAQRVNLFEKVKIPESRENIRVIKIFLGDEQTAGVARAKLAKGRAQAAEAA
jgi:V/A-type H+-transporting ATPase subunit D